MKTVAKVFVILGIIGAVIGLASLVLLGISVISGAAFAREMIGQYIEEIDSADEAAINMAFMIAGGTLIASSISMVIPLGVGIFAYKKLGRATSKSELVVPAVLEIIFGGGLLAGIFMLCVSDSELGSN